jgi:ABC-type sugar transport system permease subunit
VGPAALLVALILGFPVVFGIYRSLFRIEILNPSRPFIGLGNYTDLFSDPLFWSAMANPSSSSPAAWFWAASLRCTSRSH